jgi:SAM-dependent methyltransferase
MGPGITLVGDLVEGKGIPSEAFDCVILTQTLQLIYDTRSAVETVHRVLRPGGTALVTVPGMSPMTKDSDGKWGYFWGFTSLSANRLFQECFPGGSVEAEAWGNALTATAFLQGLAAHELAAEQLLHQDPQFELLVTVRATKGPAGA